MADKKQQAALVIGAGVGGVKASLDLAETGLKVYLCDLNPDIGGTLMQMDKWFPNSHCGMCQMLPLVSGDESVQFCLRRGLNHPNIEFLPQTELVRLDGQAGDFTAIMKKKPTGVKRDLCSGCGLCAEVCPVETDSEFNQGLSKRKAIYVRNPMVAANAYIVDWDICTRCGICQEKCPNNAIDITATEEDIEINVGAVVLSTGFEEFNAVVTSEYGYSRFENIVTSIEVERMISPSGPTGGSIQRPSDGTEPSSVAFLQCVGSREMDWNYCSSACCMYAIKEAILIKEAKPDTDVVIFYMDIRAFGKGNYRYYLDAKEKYGIKFVRSRVPTVKKDFTNGDILLSARDEKGEIQDYRFAMTVLSVGQVPAPGFDSLTASLDIDTNRWGFCQSQSFSSVTTSKAGVFVCGSASAPKDIADTLVEAGAAASEVSRLLTVPHDSRISEPETADDKYEESRTAVIVCDCGNEIGGVIDIPGLIEYSESRPGVVAVKDMSFLCREDGFGEMVSFITDNGINRLILAGCSANVIAGKVTETLKNAQSTKVIVQYLNLREGVAWVHREQPEAANDKARKLIAMAVEKARLQTGISAESSLVTGSALVIGGGISGLKAAQSIAGHGYEVHLIEKTGQLGGNLQHIFSTLGDDDPQMLLHETIDAVTNNDLITVHKDSTISEVSGYAGNFTVMIRRGDDTVPVQTGTIIVATGASEYRPSEYAYQDSDAVITQAELEMCLSGNVDGDTDLKSIVMIQCVGSRNHDRPYCSRICCSQAVKNALTLKSRNPNAQIFVLYRDMMTYGFMEEYYTKARESGVLFVRYSEEQEPVVKTSGGSTVVEFEEPVLHETLSVSADIVVLSPAVIPEESNETLSKILDIPLTDDGFYREAEVKFRPVDFNKEGVFACGMALQPQNIGESITQALAAAQRAVNLLGRQYLTPSSIVAEVNPRWCTGCEICISACPYGARVKDERKGIVIVREALCQGCGACAAVCPSGATRMKQFTDKQVFSMIDAGI